MDADTSCYSSIVKILNSGKITQAQAKRLRVVKSMFIDKLNRSSTARQLGLNFPFVDRWKKRWLESAEQRRAWYAAAGDQVLERDAERKFVLSLVADKARSGAPPRFDQAVRDQIIAISLQKPAERGVPIERWSCVLLADHLVEQGIVETISSSTVSDFLKSASGKPSS